VNKEETYKCNDSAIAPLRAGMGARLWRREEEMERVDPKNPGKGGNGTILKHLYVLNLDLVHVN